MGRRLVLIAMLVLVAEWGAFRFIYRDLLWLDAQAAPHPSAADIRASADSVLQRPHPSRRHLEALIRLSNRDDLRDVQAEALEKLAAREPDDPAVLLRLAEALRLAGRLDESARVFARVAEAR
jgi:hypothetical protein